MYFNWRLITLQYCLGFAIHQHESTMGVHMFPILNPSPYTPRKPELKETRVPQCSSQHCLYSQDMEATQMSISSPWIRKLWYIYTMEYYSAIKKNTFESVLMRWMKLEPIIQSEVSQKEKHQYSILAHIYEIQKDGNDNPVCETAKETQRYRTVFWTLWERARVGSFDRIAMKQYITMCEIDDQSKFDA